MEAKKSNRGGSRPGAGRKKRTDAPAAAAPPKPAVKSKPAQQSKPTPESKPPKAAKPARAATQPTVEADPAPIGRPSLYRPEYAEQTRKLCELGATDVELANFFDVAVSTIYLWSVNHRAFSEAKRLGKDRVDDRVEQSLFKRAMGYEHDEIDIRTVALGANAGSEIVKTPIRKHYPPDTTAMIFWLKNRRSDKWRDKIDLDAKVEMTFDERVNALSAKVVPPHAALPQYD